MATAREKLIGLQNVELPKVRKLLGALQELTQQALAIMDATLITDATAKQAAAANFRTNWAAQRTALIAAVNALAADFDTYEPPAGGAV